MNQKVGILLDEDVLRRAKRHAADEGRSLNNLIQDALEKYLTAGLRGRDAVVVMSANEFEKLSQPRGQPDRLRSQVATCGHQSGSCPQHRHRQARRPMSFLLDSVIWQPEMRRLINSCPYTRFGYDSMSLNFSSPIRLRIFLRRRLRGAGCSASQAGIVP